MNDLNKKHYDLQAKTHGGFKDVPRVDDYLGEKKPEDVFDDLVIKYGGNDKTGLDIGCGDGTKTIKYTPYYKKILGIDYSEPMIKIAKKNNATKNIEYIKGDVEKMPIESNSIDVAWSRRGPTLKKEIRVLKDTSIYIQLKVANRDCIELKKIFGRGQGYEKLDLDDLKELEDIYIKSGFTISIAKRIKYVSYYIDNNFIEFLQNTPTIVDFNLEKDRDKVEMYIENYKTPNGIKLDRERILFVAKR